MRSGCSLGTKLYFRDCQKSWLHRGWLQRATEHCASQKLERKLDAFIRKKGELSGETGRFNLATKASVE
jgi:hypothetical protein